MPILAEIQFGREVCGDLDAAEKREWLVTNGIGGYASGTVAGTATRRYHGLLMAALEPPAGRTLLVSGLDENVRYLDSTYSLATNRWASGFISPSGFLQIESFHIEGTKPVWRFAFADAIVEKRVWMAQGANTTYIQYTLLRASESVDLDLKVLVTYREFHATTHADGWQMKIEPVENGLRVDAFEGAIPFVMKSTGAWFQPRQEWYRDYLCRRNGPGDWTIRKIVFSLARFTRIWTSVKRLPWFSPPIWTFHSMPSRRAPRNPTMNGGSSETGKSNTPH